MKQIKPMLIIATQFEIEKERDSDANKAGCCEINIMINNVPLYPHKTNVCIDI